MGDTVEIERDQLTELVIQLGSWLLSCDKDYNREPLTHTYELTKAMVERRLTAYRAACEVLGLGEMSEITAPAERLLSLPLRGSVAL